MWGSDVGSWCPPRTLLCCSCLYVKAHGDIMLSRNRRHAFRGYRNKRNCTGYVPVEINPPFPRAADREVWYFTVIFICFFHFFHILVPCSSSVFTNVSIDDWLHLMERVFAVRVIQLGVYHRALEHSESTEEEKEQWQSQIDVDESEQGTTDRRHFKLYIKKTFSFYSGQLYISKAHN